MAFAEFGETDRALKRAESLHRTEQEKRALYEYQVDELERASLREQEDDILETELNLLQHAEDIRLRTNEFEGEAYDAENSLLDRIRFHLHQLSPYSGDSTHLREACTALENVCDNLESAVIEVRRMIDQLSVDDDRLHTVESRLDEINRLKYKYKKNLPDLIVYYEEIAGELKAMGSREEEIEALTRQKEAVGKRVLETATVLSDLRKATAVRMASVIEADLRQLAIASARFVIDVNPAQSGSLIGDVAMGPDGGDDVIFRFSANPEKAPDILSQCASGGELSRILLTLKKALAERDRGRCIVFDEVDTGIGGKTADILGEFISEISDFHQVLCITHLPQVAVYAENHYAIEKKIDANETIIDFHKLNSDERRWEIARMLSGTQTEAALAHADEMLGNITRKGKSYV
jgi:DNA repair protein RecN (Recombination protein N)